MRRARLPLFAALLLLVGTTLAAPAHADGVRLHGRYLRALSSFPLDSTSWTQVSAASAAAAGFDTLSSVLVSTIANTRPASSDTAHAPFNFDANKSGHPHDLWLVIEVTGTLNTFDSLYVGIQGTQGPLNDNSNTVAGGQNTPENWRWYTLQPVALAVSSALPVLVNNTGTATFICPIPSFTGSPNNWFDNYAIRFILQSDTGTSGTACAQGTRAFLRW